MVQKLSKSLVLVLVLSIVSTGVVFAAEGTSSDQVRFLGEITNVDVDAESFSIHSRSGEDLRFTTIKRTQFRSRDGSIQTLADLSVGMKALVSAYRDHDGHLVAIKVAAGDGADFEDLRRFHGTISAVDIERSSFTLELEEGGVQQFLVSDRTRFKSRDGSITELIDLEAGMVAYVVAHEGVNQVPLALIVAAGKPAESPDRFRVSGEITKVVPGQGIFELETKNGNLLSLQVVDRTEFRSRDGSINSIHDLKKGMHALVMGVRDIDGSLIAYVVAAGDLENNPGLARLDIRALGVISSLGDRTFTLETKGQGQLTFSVDGATIFKSRDGSVENFEDLQIGMIAVVGGKELEGREIKAIVVGAALPRTEQVDGSSQHRPAAITAPQPHSDS